ncbi:D-alanyl-D-alanine carboxypeptidase/D-alanyl-D-alanine endopeptidase [Parapusillimonas sp. JC17]|uniref:D-alanyl-D-alanine carboxypeptidase/D-alanyl-D-alanine endopeptidase n=1 Tax=Parapusillimonas sp. JC17 TaxID=3445768 RepID=UPI003FA0433E
MFLLLTRLSLGRRIRLWAKRLGAIFVLAGLWAASAVAQGLPKELGDAWRATRLPEGVLSLMVKEADGPVLFSISPDTPRNPASVMKMVTTWTALAGLGPDYTWRTAFYAKDGGRIDEQGTLNGPLYLKAAGDPLLTMEELWGLMRELRLRGIKNLNEVIVDRSVFGPVTIDPGIFDGAPDRPYNASPDAMMVGLGALRVLFQPDRAAQKWLPVLDPPLKSYRVNGDIKWSSGTCTGSPSVSAQVAAVGNEIVVNVSGTAAASCGEFSVYRLAISQPEYFSALFQMLWKELGGTLARGVKEGKMPGGLRQVVWHDSETLADTIRLINKQSNNVMARTLLLTLGAQMHGDGATPQTGAAAALSVLKGQGVDTRGWVIDNGAGLSREGRLTARGLVGMLEAAWRSPMMPEFISSLAISGVDGTVRRRLRNDQAKGMAHLKTGTLRDVRALAGYVLGASGKRYILVSIVNDERTAAARPFDDALISWLAAR